MKKRYPTLITIAAGQRLNFDHVAAKHSSNAAAKSFDSRDQEASELKRKLLEVFPDPMPPQARIRLEEAIQLYLSDL